jgi:hypothetical protein
LRRHGGLDIELEVSCILPTGSMRREHQAPVRLAQSNFSHSY